MDNTVLLGISETLDSGSQIKLARGKSKQFVVLCELIYVSHNRGQYWLVSNSWSCLIYPPGTDSTRNW